MSGTNCTADDYSTIADCTEITSCVNSPDDGFVCICPCGYKGDGRIGGNNDTMSDVHSLHTSLILVLILFHFSVEDV